MKKSIIYISILLSVMLLPICVTARQIRGEASVIESTLTGNSSESMTSHLIFCNAENTKDDGRIELCEIWESSPATILGETITSKGGDDWAIVKYDKDGNIEWWKQYGGNSSEDYAKIMPIEDGYILVGETSSTDIEGITNKGALDIIMVKFDLDGNILWQKSWGGSSTDDLDTVYIYEDGSAVVVGDSELTDIEGLVSMGSYDIFVVKFDSTGNVVWQKTYGGNGIDWYHNEQETSDNGYIIRIWNTSSNTINGIPVSGGSDGAIMKFNHNWELEWQKNWGGNGRDYLTNIIEQSDGYLSIGDSYSSNFNGLTNSGGQDAIMIKYDKNGNILWQQKFGGNGDDEYKDIREMSNGFLIKAVSSSTNLEDIPSDSIQSSAIILKYDKEGNLVNTESFPDQKNSFYLDNLVCSEDDICIHKYYTTSDSTKNDIVLMKLDSNVNVVWEKTYGGNGDDYTSNIKILPDGKILFEVRTQSTDLEGIVVEGEEGRALVQLDSDGNLMFQKNINQNIWNTTKDGGILMVEHIFEVNENATTEEEYLASLKLDVFIKKYDKDWNLEWQYDYDGETLDIILAIEEISKDRYRAIGETVDIVNEKFTGLQLDLYYEYEVTTEETTNGIYEVKQEDDKGVITLSPNKGYTLDKLTITNDKGEQIEYYEESGTYYFNLEDGLKINVTYKEDISNPNTITFLKLGFIAVIIFAIYNLFISKKLKIKRFA